MPDFPTLSAVAGLSVSIGPDPLTDAVTEVLTVPLRELYAVLWRVGLVDIEEGSPRSRAPERRIRGAIAATDVAAVAVPSACAHPTGPNGVLPSS